MKRYVLLRHALSSGIVLATLYAFPQQRPIAIAHVRSARAQLRQQGRLTILELSSTNNRIQRIPLSHPSNYLQGTVGPYEARLVAESPHHFLIFTDTFDSNPGNIQGECGASDTGERFVHVVALGAFPHETLSTLVESCLLMIEPSSTSPEWLAKPDSAGFVGRLVLHIESDPQSTITYYVSADGSVSRPEIKSNP